MELLSNPIVISLIVGTPASVLAYLAYKRGVRADKAAERSGALQANSTAIQQVIDGLNRLIDNLQEDNKLLRESVSELDKRLIQITTENLDLKKQISVLKSKYE